MKRTIGLALLLLTACGSETVSPGPAAAPVSLMPEHHFDCTTWQTQTATPDGHRELQWGPPFLYDPFGPGPDPRTETYGAPPPPSKWEAECKGNSRCVFLPLKWAREGRFEDGQPFTFSSQMGRVMGFSRTSARFDAELRLTSSSDGIGVPVAATDVDAHEGDLVPTLWGAARVVRIFPPISKSTSDGATGYVQLHILGEGPLARYADANRIFVGPGIRATLGDDQIFMDWRNEGTPKMVAEVTDLQGPTALIPNFISATDKGIATGGMVEIWSRKHRVLSVQTPNASTRGWIELRTIPE